MTAIELLQGDIERQREFARHKLKEAEDDGDSEGREAWIGYCAALRWVDAQIELKKKLAEFDEP